MDIVSPCFSGVAIQVGNRTTAPRLQVYRNMSDADSSNMVVYIDNTKWTNATANLDGISISKIYESPFSSGTPQTHQDNSILKRYSIRLWIIEDEQEFKINL